MNGFRWPGQRRVAPETPLQLAERLPNLRTDPRLVHTSETSPEPAGEAGVEGPSEVDVAAAMAALRRRVEATRTAPVVPVRPVAEPLTVEQMIAAEFDRRERERAEAAERAERQLQHALAQGGPCRWCGATASWERDEHGTPMGKWYSGPECASCNSDRAEWPKSTDLDRRLAVVNKLLPRDVTKWWTAEYLLERTHFKWWSETPGAVTSDRERFAYVDTAAMVEALTTKPVEYETREPCQRCGCPSRWMWTRSYQVAGSGHVAVEQWTCKGCHEVDDILALTSRVIGLGMPTIDSVGTLAGKTLGVTWWADSPDGGKADPPRPCETPFGYIDWDAVRRNAFEAFPGERQWGSVTAWEHARAVSQS